MKRLTWKNAWKVFSLSILKRKIETDFCYKIAGGASIYFCVIIKNRVKKKMKGMNPHYLTGG